MPPRSPKKGKAKKPAKKKTPARRRRTGAWAVAGFAPLAIGIAAGSPALTGAPSVASGPPGVEVPAGSNYIDATRAIRRLGITGPSQEVLTTWERPAPNKSRLGDCGWFGSEGSDKITNQRKNRTDLPPSYHAVTFDAITDLDWPRDAKTRRDKWTSEQLAEIAPYEGAAVTVTGFVVALRPQAGNTESTNCGEGGEEKTDWHVALVGEFGDAEKLAVVVEPTPRIKRLNPAWTPAALRPFVGTRDSVRFSGYLLLDPVHKNHLGKYRQTLWEMHPVHRIEVFRGGAWRDLDGP